MNLKEAFRYQNKLQSFMDEAQGILDRDANVTKVENTYLRHKVMAEAEDETVLIAPETEYYEQITDIAVRGNPHGERCPRHRHGQRGQPQCHSTEHRPYLQADERSAQLGADHL